MAEQISTIDFPEIAQGETFKGFSYLIYESGDWTDATVRMEAKANGRLLFDFKPVITQKTANPKIITVDAFDMDFGVTAFKYDMVIEANGVTKKYFKGSSKIVDTISL